MVTDIEAAHKKAYDDDKKRRWDIAKDMEERAIKTLCNSLAEIYCLGKEKIKFCRYDMVFFDKFELSDTANEWVKGAPDYCVLIRLEKNKILYVEVKLKCVEFMKTIEGGLTKNGSDIAKYGCSSYYLDEYPVYENMKIFSKKVNLPPTCFWIAFIKDDLSKIKLITLDKVTQIEENGWKGIPLCRFGEGYGQKTYLIPTDATISPQDISKELLLKSAADKIIVPRAHIKLKWAKI